MRSNLIAVLMAVPVAMCAFPQDCAAQSHNVMKVRNMNPFYMMYCASGPQSADLLGEGRFATDLSLSTSNNSITSSSNGETITIDGESYVADIELRYGLLNNLEISARLPLIFHTPGYFDNLIEKWHDWFRLSNSRRDAFPSNQLKYEYIDNGVTLVSLTHKESGVGDAAINAKYRFLEGESGTLYAAVAAGLKLPTGDASQLTGSDAVDADISVHLSELRWLSKINTRFYGGAGISFLGQGGVLAARQNSTHYSAYLGADWSINPQLSAIVQLDYQTAFYRSALAQLGKDSTQLYVGGSYLAESKLRYDFGLGENLYTDGTPDFLLYFSVSIPH